MRAATVVQVLQDFKAPPAIAPRPPTTVANPHIDRSLGSKETHIQSHKLVLSAFGTSSETHSVTDYYQVVFRTHSAAARIHFMAPCNRDWM